MSRRPHIAVLLSLCLGACRGSEEAEYVVPKHLEIEVVGAGFEWEVRYPGPDGRLGTDDDRFGTRDVHVPAAAHTRIHLRSRDYIYTFALPHLGLKEIAVPDLEYSLEFTAGAEGRYELRGDQMCGYSHPDLIGTLVVESPEAYVSTMKKLGPRGSG